MTALTQLETLKTELGVTGSASDTRLTLLITQVSAAIETFLDRRLARATVTDTFTSRHRTLYLSSWPVVSVTSVTESGTLLTTDQYAIDTAEGIITRPLYGVGYGSPWGTNWAWLDTVVVYSAGYLLPGSVSANLPGDIERACLDMAIRYHHIGGRDPTLRSETVPGVIEQSWSAADTIETIGGLPCDIARTLFPYKRAVL
jgi:hypothetical protein